MRVTGQGEPGVNGGPSGDLYVVFHIRSHEFFERDGDDVYCEMPITFVQAALGDDIEVPTLHGKVKLKVPAGTQTGTKFRLRGKGIPNVRGRGTGDQHIIVKVVTPTKLTEKQKQLLQEFAEISGSVPNNEQEEGFFDKVKRAFKGEINETELVVLKWSEISIHTTNEAIEPISNILHEAGASGVVIEDPFELVKIREDQFGEIYQLNPKDYPEEGVIVKAYLPINSFLGETIEEIKSAINNLIIYNIDIGKNDVSVSEVNEEEWATAWKKYYHPVKISKRFTVVPTWEEYTPVNSDELDYRIRSWNGFWHWNSSYDGNEYSSIGTYCEKRRFCY